MAIKSNIIFKLWLALIPLRIFSSGKEITQVCTILLWQLEGAVRSAHAVGLFAFSVFRYQSTERAEHTQAAAAQHWTELLKLHVKVYVILRAMCWLDLLAFCS